MSERDELYAVLIGLHDDALLLPNVCVAEVLPADTREWNGRPLRVLRFETLNGGAEPPPSPRARVVVLQPLEASADAACGLWAQGYPRLVTLNRAALQTVERRPTDVAGLVQARVRIASTEALIPDLDALFAATRS